MAVNTNSLNPFGNNSVALKSCYNRQSSEPPSLLVLPLILFTSWSFLKRRRKKSKEQKKYCAVTISLPHYLCHAQMDFNYVSHSFLMVSLSDESVSPARQAYSVVYLFSDLCALPGSIFQDVVLAVRSENHYCLQRHIRRSSSCSHWVHGQNPHKKEKILN